MKIYKYWQIQSGNFTVDQKWFYAKCYGGSNVSEEDARLKAQEKIEKIKRKVAGDASVFETYEAEIREDIVRVISEKAIVTRNSYGAQVLNIEDVLIMDIDQPKFSFMDLFKQTTDKQKMIELVRKLAQKPAYRDYGYRIYETQKGIRVIVLGRTFDPTARETQAMMAEFNCDRLYRFLCQKQKCFRARLTPKASRMNLRGHRVKILRTAEAEMAFQQWLAGYEAASLNYSVCKFIEQIGAGYLLPDAIQFHDEMTGIHRNLTLA